MALKDFFRDKPSPPPTEIPNKITGSILHLNKDGFGFIQSKEIPFERIYFRWDSLSQETKRFNDLKRGMNVEFTPKKYPKGWRAIKIKVTDE